MPDLTSDLAKKLLAQNAKTKLSSEEAAKKAKASGTFRALPPQSKGNAFGALGTPPPFTGTRTKPITLRPNRPSSGVGGTIDKTKIQGRAGKAE